MKKLLLLALSTFIMLDLFGQSQGISYQAVIIDKNAQEIPGVDVTGNIMPNQPMQVRFTILNATSTIDFQEEHVTTTDSYGMINLTIGIGTQTAASPNAFNGIDWNGTPKNIKVEISLGTTDVLYNDFRLQELTFVPYAYHKNITATGTMIIEDVTDLNSDLNVNNGSPTYLTGTIDVDGIANLNSTLYVNNGGATNLSGELNVLGETILQNVNLTTINSISNEATFVATFENTNDGNGDGIKIKLGKRATKNNALAGAADTTVKVFFGEVTLAEFNSITGILDGTLNGNDITYLAGLAVPRSPAEATEDALAIAATACQLTETIGSKLTDFLNTSLHLPIKIGPWGYAGVDVVPEVTVFPSLPPVNLPCGALGDGYSLPGIKVSDVWVTDPLKSENLFIEFTDNADFTMGAIKAQSIENWAKQSLNIVFLYDLISTFKGIDKSKILPEMAKKGKEIAKSYLKIGVEYSSGNGDYAEWLERLDSTEIISSGDVVGVIGGRITKDLTNAEQVMAVSTNPIVLGNTPKAGKEYLGKKVAFMGQIPVKIMGPVHTGDYIVGKGNIPGYGIAISQKDMSLEDFKYVVGRSWVENISTGPKLVNTVVGVHNGDYLNILKQYEERFKNSENRLKNIEDKLELLIK